MVLNLQNQIDQALYKYINDEQALFVKNEFANANKVTWHTVDKSADHAGTGSMVTFRAFSNFVADFNAL